MMMSDPIVGVRVHFLLPYRGHSNPGVGEAYPSWLRIFSAAVSATEGGNVHGDVLRWMERNPPDVVTLPEVRHGTPDTKAYRNMGQRSKDRIRVKGKSLPHGSDFSGPVCYGWSSRPPEWVVSGLSDIVTEIPYIGMAESPAACSVGDIVPTHAIDPEADLFSGSGIDLEIALPGRLDELTAAYEDRPKIKSSDYKGKTVETDTSIPIPRRNVATVRYVPVGSPSAAALTPWSHVLIKAIDPKFTVDSDWTVFFVKHVHRALVSLIGDGAPSALTGVYPLDAGRPANQIAVHVIPRSKHFSVINDTDNGEILAVLLPQDLSPSDIDVVKSAVDRLQRVTLPGGRSVRLNGTVEVVRADEFWPPCPAGSRRLWQTQVPYVPDIKSPDKTWTLTDAVQLSVAMAWRDIIPDSGSTARLWAMKRRTDAVKAGVRVLDASMVVDGDLSRFVHKTKEGFFVQPWNVTLDLGSIAPRRTLSAIGQSRHFGGGLLVPLDVPLEISDDTTKN